jgi:hypothetical protein
MEHRNKKIMEALPRHILTIITHMTNNGKISNTELHCLYHYLVKKNKNKYISDWIQLQMRHNNITFN